MAESRARISAHNFCQRPGTLKVSKNAVIESRILQSSWTGAI